LWILGLGGVGIIIGLATWGWRVMETIGAAGAILFYYILKTIFG